MDYLASPSGTQTPVYSLQWWYDQQWTAMHVESNGRDEILNTVLPWEWRSKGFDAQGQQTQMANPHRMYDIKNHNYLLHFRLFVSVT